MWDYQPDSGNTLAQYLSKTQYNFNTVLIEQQLFPRNSTPHYATDLPSKNFLDRANSLGMKVILKCPDINVDQFDSTLTNQYDSVLCHQGLIYYGYHPSLLGFSICDEPQWNHFNSVSSYSEAIENFDSSLLRYNTLLPLYAAKERLVQYPSTSIVNDYECYLDSFFIKTNPNIFSFDHYPIWMNCTLVHPPDTSTFYWPSDFYYNLDIIAKKSRQYDIPFVYTLSTVDSVAWFGTENYAPRRAVGYAGLNYLIYSAMSYGAKGISYFIDTYWNLLTEETKIYAGNLHKKLLDHEGILTQLKFESAYHKSNQSTIYLWATDWLPPYSIWSNFASDSCAQSIFDVNNPLTALGSSSLNNIAVSFLTDDGENKFFWVLNKNMQDSVELQLNLLHNVEIVDILNPENCQKSSISLKPGEGKLFCTISPKIILQDVTWNKERVENSVVVDSGATLVITSKVRFIHNAQLVVRPGGKLVVNGGTLTNFCDGELWQGIVVEGQRDLVQTESNQGVVELEDAIIANAETAISAGYDRVSRYIRCGGIIEARNSQFLNNKRSVTMYPYSYINSANRLLDNVSYFAHCTFVTDNNAFFEVTDTLSQVYLSGINGLVFNGCTFTDMQQKDAHYQYGVAINAYESGVAINSKKTISAASTLHYYGFPCTFSGYGIAVKINNSSASTSTIINTNFEDNYQGVVMEGSVGTRIETCNFNLNNFSLEQVGVVIDNSTGYNVANNIFWGTGSTGILVKGKDVSNNVISNNNFENLCVGVVIDGIQMDVLFYQNHGLQILCNQFRENNDDILLTENGRIRMFQGEQNSAAGNIFQGQASLSNISNHGQGNLKYYYKANSIYHQPSVISRRVVLEGVNNSRCVLNGANGDLYYETFLARDLDTLNLQYEELATTHEGLVTVYQSSYNDEINWDIAFVQWEIDPTFTNRQIVDFLDISNVQFLLDECCRKAIFTIMEGTNVDIDNYNLWLSRLSNTSSMAGFAWAKNFYLLNDSTMVVSIMDSNLQQSFSIFIENQNYRKCMEIYQRWAYDTCDILSSDINFLEEISSGTLIDGITAKTLMDRINGNSRWDRLVSYCILEAPMMSPSPQGELKEENSIKAASFRSNLLLSPNPCVDKITLKVTNGEAKIAKVIVFNNLGKLLLQLEGESQELTIDVANLPNAVYWGKCYLSNNELMVKKIVINK